MKLDEEQYKQMVKDVAQIIAATLDTKINVVIHGAIDRKLEQWFQTSLEQRFDKTIRKEFDKIIVAKLTK